MTGVACAVVRESKSLFSVRRRWSWASVRVCSFVFQAGRCPQIDNVVTAALLPHQPDELRRRRDRVITASARHRWPYRRRNGTKRKFFNDFSRACVRVRARRGAFGVLRWTRGAGLYGGKALPPMTTVILR